jgi:outer membrane lipoprotein
MKHLRNFGLSVVLAAFVILAGCAYPISSELRHEAKQDVTFAQVIQNPDAFKGTVVIWGGKILDISNQANGTELTILQVPLDYEEIPRNDRASQGRFIAISKQFLDPELYQKGKKITLAGEITGHETLDLGKMQYNYPTVSVREIHLWRETVYIQPYYPYYYYGWWGGWGWGWDQYYYPYRYSDGYAYPWVDLD